MRTSAGNIDSLLVKYAPDKRVRAVQQRHYWTKGVSLPCWQLHVCYDPGDFTNNSGLLQSGAV